MNSTVIAEPPRAGGYEEQEGHRVIRRLRLLLERRFVILRFTICGAALATLFAFLIPFRYDAQTKLMPPDNEMGSGLASLLTLGMRGGGGGLGMLAGDFLGLKTSGALFIGILRSETVEDRIIDQFDLKSVYMVRQMQAARRMLEANTEISEDRKSGIITIRVSDHTGQRAKAIADAYVTELDRLVAELNTSAAHRERIFLEERLKTVKQDLDTSAKEFSRFASDNTAIDIKEQGKAMVGAAATLQGHLIAAESELEGLRQIYADSNVRVRALQARIEELKAKLDQMGEGDVSAAAGAGSALYPSIRKLPLLGVTYAELYRNNKIQETVFELLTQECELAKVQEAKETPSVKVLDVARLPEKKAFPPRLMLMFLGTFFSIMIGSLWVLARGTWEDIDVEHPGKVLAHDAYRIIKADLGLANGNGTRLHSVRKKMLGFRRNSSRHEM
ncbi:MAG TPA: GNVR domain-containing protein [Candidatus Sulfotelmatobacter sp.]|nr:GNVR domain-containing protein [Candidatus Sulfotelmatobacter sp.]